jgi:serine phosphatase RsbU (regulator of sigma subunit)
MVREFIRENLRLIVAGAVGLALFLALYGPVFMREARPQPLDRDTIIARALEFAALEGWNDPSRFAWAVPIEGDDAAAVRAAGGQVPDREALPDPAWEVGVFSEPGSLTRIFNFETPPSPMLAVAVTPEGQVVQYLEASSPISGAGLQSIRRNRTFPVTEFEPDRIFEVEPGDRAPVTEEERAAALATARAFFARHGIERPEPPAFFAVRERRDRERFTSMAWERPGPGGTTDTVRVGLLGDRVAAYDYDLRTDQPREETSRWQQFMAQGLPQVGFLAFLIGTALIGVLVALKRRQGEIDFVAAMAVFLFYMALSLADKFFAFGYIGAAITMGAGMPELWVLWWVPTLAVMPIIAIAAGLMVGGAWAVGESESYAVWPQHVIRPMSAAMRGRFRTREAAAPVVAGYLAGFVGLGATALFGLVAPSPQAPSVAPFFDLGNWPVFLAAVSTALSSALLTTIVAYTFVLTYVRRITRRTWVAVSVAAFVATLQLSVEPILPFAYWTGLIVMGSGAVGLAFVFMRYGALAAAAAAFAYLLMMRAYPLVLTGNVSHAASGVWALALGAAPLAVVAYGAWRPRGGEERPAVPTHVRRVLERLRISEEFEVARRVQAGLLPAAAPQVRGLDVAGVCVPANEVGGDYYDYFHVGEDRLAIAIGDVSGKGVGAAIYMTLTKSYMVTQAPRAADPVRVLSRVNSHLKRNLERGTFVTMAYAVLDASARTLTYTRAGHNPPLLIRADGEGDFLSASGLALGSAGPALFENLTHAETVDLRPGDLLLLYTDGVTEAMDVIGREYGEERLVSWAVATARSGAPASEAVDALLKDVREFTGRAPQHDDITIVAVRVTD